MGEWKEYKLGDLITLNYGKGLKEENRVRGNVPVYSSAGLSGYHNEPLTNSSGLVVGRKGTIGKVFYSDQPFWCIDTAYYILPNDDNYELKFLFYFLRTLGLEELNEDSAVPGLNRNTFYSLETAIPLLPEQRAIASILSSLDDKIDLLHRQNKTLEALAETLFRQWFVEEADESWEEKSLYDLMEIIGGGTPKTEISEYWDGEINWMSGKDITANHKQFILTTEKNISMTGLKNSSAKVLPKFASVVSARGTVGKICLLSRPMAFSQTNYGILPKIKDCFFFSYLLLSYSVEELQSAAYGCVFDTITTNTFKEHKISIPKESEILKLEAKVSSLFYKMFSNENQIRTLTQLRDTLLPKLMSGEIRLNCDLCD
jgi:type I restriction enzyme S subunit